jgi:hypothetical protein
MNLVSERDLSWVANNRCLLETYKYSHSGFCFHMVSYVRMTIYNRIGEVMVKCYRLQCGRSRPGRVKPKTIKLVSVASPLSTQH